MILIQNLDCTHFKIFHLAVTFVEAHFLTSIVEFDDTICLANQIKNSQLWYPDKFLKYSCHVHQYTTTNKVF